MARSGRLERGLDQRWISHECPYGLGQKRRLLGGYARQSFARITVIPPRRSYQSHLNLPGERHATLAESLALEWWVWLPGCQRLDVVSRKAIGMHTISYFWLENFAPAGQLFDSGCDSASGSGPSRPIPHESPLHHLPDLPFSPPLLLSILPYCVASVFASHDERILQVFGLKSFRSRCSIT